MSFSRESEQQQEVCGSLALSPAARSSAQRAESDLDRTSRTGRSSAKESRQRAESGGQAFVDDGLIQTLSADRADDPPYVGVLTRWVWRRDDLGDLHRVDPAAKF
jgi:hypothetical protein